MARLGPRTVALINEKLLKGGATQTAKTGGRGGVLMPGRGGSVLDGSCSVGADGSRTKDYAFTPRLTVAAGALAAGSIGDLLDADNSGLVEADGKFPYPLEVTQAQLYVGVNLNASDPVENIAAIIGSAHLVLEVHGDEEKRWPLAMFNPEVGYVGGDATGVHGTVQRVTWNPVAFPLTFVENVPYALQIHLEKGFTSVNVIEFALACRAKKGGAVGK